MNVVNCDFVDSVFVVELLSGAEVHVKANSYRKIGASYCFYSLSDKQVTENFKKQLYCTPVYELDKVLVQSISRKGNVVGYFLTEEKE